MNDKSLTRFSDIVQHSSDIPDHISKLKFIRYISPSGSRRTDRFVELRVASLMKTLVGFSDFPVERSGSGVMSARR